jgi:hypothetical protein
MALAATGLVRGRPFELDLAASPQLFVFRAPDSANTVIGLSIAPDQASFAAATALIHVGAKTWSVKGRGSAYLASDDGARIFAGGGMMGGRFVEMIVLELDAHELARTAAFDVWAETFRGGGFRRRIGNPIVAELVRCDREFRQIHHRISPGDDRAVLTPIVRRIVAARAERFGITGDPDAYARRLTDALLPDVISFKPASPLGFSYASQNGRHPAERTAEIVQTLLGGPLVPDFDQRETTPGDRFPYLISPTELTS